MSEFKKVAETSEKSVIPWKKNKIKDIWIIDLRNLIVLNLPIEASNIN